MRVLVDVGSHEGQTLEEVIKPRWGFDMIHAIEPMPREFATLIERYAAHPKVVLHPFALSNYTGSVPMYGTNDLLEASVFAGKDDADESVTTEVACVDAAAFFRSLPGDELLVNMNCEGAEIPILDSLLDNGEIGRISHMLISFDIRKVPGMEDEELRVRHRMASVGFDRFTSTYPEADTHQEQIAAWLEAAMWP